MLSLDVLAVALTVEGTLIAAALGGLVVLRLYLVWRARQVEAGSFDWATLIRPAERGR